MTSTAPKAGDRRKPVPRVVHKAGTWVCPRCSKKVDILVPLTAQPICADHKGGHPTVMERTGK